jgi:hypothetical protein
MRRGKQGRSQESVSDPGGRCDSGHQPALKWVEWIPSHHVHAPQSPDGGGLAEVTLLIN